MDITEKLRWMADRHTPELTEAAGVIVILRDELKNIAAAKWREFDPDPRRAAYEFVQWAQSRSRHALEIVGTGDTAKSAECDCLSFWKSHHPECPTMRHNVN